jgi:glycosyltransferase involved in cell wall biosynthesis
MRILVIEYRDITHPEAGGAEVILLEIFKRLVAGGHQVDYLCNRHGNAPSEEFIEGIRIIRRGAQPYFNLLVPWVYRRELRRNGYDVIVEGIDKLPFFMPLFERARPVVCIVPHLFGSTVFREASLPVGAYVYSYEKGIPYVYRKCLFSVLSQGTRDDLIGRGLPAEQIQVIYSGLSQEEYNAPPRKPFADHPILVYLGRIKRYKGIELGIEAVRRLKDKYPSLEYQIVGTGDYLDELKRIAVQAGVERQVTFTGLKRGREKTEILQRANVLLYTSPKEGWGLSVVEANLCGTPVVASNSPGLRESVVDGRTGFLVPHGDVPALVRRIDDLLSDADLYGRMRAAALEWGRGFTWERSTRETLALMERACAELKKKTGE